MAQCQFFCIKVLLTAKISLFCLKKANSIQIPLILIKAYYAARQLARLVEDKLRPQKAVIFSKCTSFFGGVYRLGGLHAEICKICSVQFQSLSRKAVNDKLASRVCVAELATAWVVEKEKPLSLKGGCVSLLLTRAPEDDKWQIQMSVPCCACAGNRIQGNALLVAFLPCRRGTSVGSLLCAHRGLQLHQQPLAQWCCPASPLLLCGCQHVSAPEQVESVKHKGDSSPPQSGLCIRSVQQAFISSRKS